MKAPNPYRRIFPDIKRSTKKHWDTKTRTNKNLRKKFYEAVAQWWNEKVNSGVLLNDEAYKKGTDYIGDCPWPDGVAMRAAMNDFMLSNPGVTCSQAQFMNVVKDVTKAFKTKTKTVNTTMKRGGFDVVIGSKHVTFYEFPRPHLTDPPPM